MTLSNSRTLPGQYHLNGKEKFLALVIDSRSPSPRRARDTDVPDRADCCWAVSERELVLLQRALGIEYLYEADTPFS
jgi:hypothetical protein